MNNGPPATSSLKLVDLIDISIFQRLMDSFNRLTGLSSAILELDGTVLTASGWQRICVDFHRKNDGSRMRCIESDTVLAGAVPPGDKYHMYQCKNGLVDVAAPIIIGDSHVGNLFTGQFLLQPPEESYFTDQARMFDFDVVDYLEALREVPVISGDQLQRSMAYLVDLTVIIGELAHQKQTLQKLNASLESRVTERTAALTDSEERFRALSEASFEGLIISYERVILETNVVASQMFGYSISEMVGMKSLDLVSPDEREDVLKHFEKQYTVPLQTTAIRKDGTLFPVEFAGRRFWYRGKNVAGIAIRDLTDQKKAEEEIATLRGFLPICAQCKKIRNGEGIWDQVEHYIEERSPVLFSHSLCPECAKNMYGKEPWYKKR